MSCWISGPWLVVGDVDWVCHEHDEIAELRDPSRYAARDLRRSDFYCPKDPERNGMTEPEVDSVEQLILRLETYADRQDEWFNDARSLELRAVAAELREQWSKR